MMKKEASCWLGILQETARAGWLLQETARAGFGWGYCRELLAQAGYWETARAGFG